MKQRSRKAPKLAPPSTAEDGAKRVTAATVPIFDREDGTGADWSLMVESMFRAAFAALDKLPQDSRRRIANRAHDGAYQRLTDDYEAANRESLEAAQTMSAALSAAFDSPKPKGPR